MLTYDIFCCILGDILCDILGDILCGILGDILCGILGDILCGISGCILCGILGDFLCGILGDILRGILSDILDDILGDSKPPTSFIVYHYNKSPQEIMRIKDHSFSLTDHLTNWTLRLCRRQTRQLVASLAIGESNINVEMEP